MLIGMLLDQQVPMEKAFAGPYTIAQRMGGDDLDAHAIASTAPDEFAAVLAAKPAVHRYPVAMAGRIQKLCTHLIDHYHGDAAAIWRDTDTATDVYDRLIALPGFGDHKAQVFVALLGKRLGVTPQGWRDTAGDYGQDGVYRSIADVTGPQDLLKVRETKKLEKQARSNPR